jgi:hypothetical protein
MSVYSKGYIFPILFDCGTNVLVNKQIRLRLSGISRVECWRFSVSANITVAIFRVNVSWGLTIRFIDLVEGVQWDVKDVIGQIDEWGVSNGERPTQNTAPPINSDTYLLWREADSNPPSCFEFLDFSLFHGSRQSTHHTSTVWKKVSYLLLLGL